ncbi:MAG: hypothetical protein JW915_14920 [Chitinispirillaceae bacterium]|nr:hypothetical protein [Chitinispirillaceae bacterium]
MNNIFAILMFLPLCLWAQTAQKPSQHVRLGACPTMNRHFLPPAGDNIDYEVIPFNNTMEVMAAIQAGQIDISFVGRPARESEGVAVLTAFPLGNGWTLVGRSNRMIEESSLERAIVHTIADSLTIKRYLPSTVDIRLHQSNIEALDSCGQDEIVLLPWSSYQEVYPLVIPSNSDGKLPQFRSPTLYCRKGDEKKYQSIIKHIRNYVNEKNEV